MSTVLNSELSKIKSSINYLVRISECTREQAILSLCKHGFIQSTFNLVEIAVLLELSNKKVRHCLAKAEYKINKSVKEGYITDFKEHLLSIIANNFETCLTNFGIDLEMEEECDV